MKPKVSIIILRYKEKEELFNCLKSIKKDSPKVSFEVIVVDNNKKERIGPLLKKNFSWVVYIKSPGNIGYGAGNNLGAKYARGEYLFILNPDTKVLPGAVDKLVKFLEKNKKVAVVAPNLIDAQGNLSLQLGSAKLTPLRGIVALSFLNKLFPNNPISKEYWLKDIPVDKKREVGVVPGSAFLVRKGIFEEIRGFDENFFLYFEESDFCKRVKEIGFKIFIVPQAQVIHYWQPAEGTEKTKRIFSQSRFYYFKKHYGILAAAVVEVFARFSKWHALLLVIILLGAFLRLFKGGK